MGVDGILSVTPYYNKPTQEGLYQHYKAIASAVKLPIIVYSVQGRTGVNVEPATLKRLAEIDNIVGVKEASGNIGQMAAVIQQVPPSFAVLSGDDAHHHSPDRARRPRRRLGGFERNSRRDDGARRSARWPTISPPRATLQRRYFPLMEVNFVESNPIPVKAAMALMGLLEPVWRLPLCPPSPANQAKIEKVLETLGLLAGRSVHAV